MVLYIMFLELLKSIHLDKIRLQFDLSKKEIYNKLG